MMRLNPKASNKDTLFFILLVEPKQLYCLVFSQGETIWPGLAWPGPAFFTTAEDSQVD